MTTTDTCTDRGQILILAAVSMVVLFGILALTVDASYTYDKRNRLYAAADAAAKSAAIELQRIPLITLGGLQAFANQQVAAHGFTPGSPTVVTVNHPPLSGPFVGNAQYVEVIVSEQTATFFGAVLGWTSMNPGARAVAGSSSSGNCVYILGGLMHLMNNVGLTMPGCSVAAGGSLVMENNSTITASSVGVTIGGCPAGLANCTSNVPPPTDPLGNLAPPSPPSPVPSCAGGPAQVNANVTVTVANAAQYYCGMTINNAVVTFSPGVYTIAGPMRARNGGSDVTLNGSGVMLYFAPGGSIDFRVSNHVDMTMSAPTSGPYTGVLFYQDRANTADAWLSKNNGTLTLSGAMYFPSAELTMKNNNGIGFTNDCAVIVARALTMDNNSQLSNTCSAFGGSPLHTVSIAE